MQSVHVMLDGCQLVQLDFGFNHPVLLIREERASCLCVLFLTPSYFSSSFPASDFSASSLFLSARRLGEDGKGAEAWTEWHAVNQVCCCNYTGTKAHYTAKHKVFSNQLTSWQTRSALLGSFLFAKHLILDSGALGRDQVTYQWGNTLRITHRISEEGGVQGKEF